MIKLFWVSVNTFALVLSYFTACDAQPWTGKESFRDDFIKFESSPDGSKGWMTSFPNTDQYHRTLPSNNELEYYSDSSVGVVPFELKDDGLHIIATKRSNDIRFPYTSGIITTYVSFSQLYGYFEVMAKFPHGKGLWPAFWLLPVDRSWPPEIDIVEMLGDNPTRVYFSAHTSAKENTPRASHAHDIDDVSTSFHSFGVDWEPNSITWYYDRQAIVSEATPTDMHKPMFMLLNLAVGGNWPGNPDSTTKFPADMVVSSVRVFPTRGKAFQR